MKESETTRGTRWRLEHTAVATAMAHGTKAARLLIHPFTLRKETLPDGIDARTLISFLASEDTVDGVFSDFPDIPHPQ
jgi:glycerophosphoryl diester phosphodiesterase